MVFRESDLVNSFYDLQTLRLKGQPKAEMALLCSTWLRVLPLLPPLQKVLKKRGVN